MAVVQETTEKMVRKQLQSRLGVDLSDRKAFIKEQVSSRNEGLKVHPMMLRACLRWLLGPPASWMCQP